MVAKQQNTLVIKLLGILKERKYSIPKFAEETGIPKDRIYKWKSMGNSPKMEDVHIINNWINGKPINGQMDNVPRGGDSGSINHNLTVAPEGPIDAHYLKALLTEKERVIEEKEARRKDAEARLLKADEEKDRLITIIESNLRLIHESQHAIFDSQKVATAYQMTWVEKWAEKEAGGNDDKAQQMAKAFRKDVGEKLKPKKQESSSSVHGK